MAEYDVRVAVNPVYLSTHSEPEHGHYAFAYTVVITNAHFEPVQLISRHWIITDGNGEVQEVKGLGVVGEQPKLKSGEKFQYTSSAVLHTPLGSMRGSYQMITEQGASFSVPIPMFSLVVPHVLN